MTKVLGTALPRLKNLKNDMKAHMMKVGLRIKCGVTRLVVTKSQGIIYVDETAFDPLDHLQSMCTLNSSWPFTLQIPSNDGAPKRKRKKCSRECDMVSIPSTPKSCKNINLRTNPKLKMKVGLWDLLNLHMAYPWGLFGKEWQIALLLKFWHFQINTVLNIIICFTCVCTDD